MGTQVVERTIQEQIDNLTFEESWQQQYSRILAYILRWTKNREIAEDLTQITFLRAWQAWEKLFPNSQVDHWLITIATNVTRTYFVHAQRKPSYSLEEHLEGTDMPLEIQADTDIEEGYLQQESIQEIKKKVRDALDCIPEQYRQPLLLSAEGYTAREIACETGAPINTVLTRVHRGKIALARELTARHRSNGETDVSPEKAPHELC